MRFRDESFPFVAGAFALFALIVAAFVLIFTSCASAPVATRNEPAPAFSVAVDNQLFPSVDVYLVDGSRRIARLGFVEGHEQRALRVKLTDTPQRELAFEARTITGQLVRSEPIVAHEGQVVHWVLGPAPAQQTLSLR